MNKPNEQPHEWPQGYQQPPQPVIQQQPAGVPGQFQWMPAPQAPIGCPPGLEYLLAVDQILIHQLVELLEVFTGCEAKNKYALCNSMSQQVYFAQEDTDCCTRQCCGPGRPFEMRIIDNMQREVIHLSRPVRCQCCWWPCCLQEIEIQSPPGTVIGYVEQKPSCWKPKLEIQDAKRQPIMMINGPCCFCSCGSDVEFPIHSLDGGSEIGMITKQWMGFTREVFTDAANFGIRFPLDLDVKYKAILMGAVFLVDFMFFERKK
ncbi:phospholipid scramblase 1-like isoform X2 [Orbicella faveolata]|uniref:phospholipid scramblase 1-like isoform X2 n=1 Tax=Orbicella faveolata TaxID=48498 RepID=UPI0009E30AF2|nr:phospholipid scramblase 1-like isoform X2 [Orbicella faveolata]